MKMNWTLQKTSFVQVLALGGLMALPGTIAIAQSPDAGAVAAQPAGLRTDGQIEMDVVHALDASRALKSDLITAATIQGEVTLSGTVSSDASSELAESIAAHVPGVTAVHNNLKVGNPQGAAQAPNSTDPGAQQMADSQGDDSMAPIAPPSAVNEGPTPAPGSPQAQAPYPPAQPQYPSARPQYGPPQSPYPQQYPPANPQIYRTRPAEPDYAEPRGPVTIPQGTLLQLRTSEGLASKRAKDGEPVQFIVIRDVAVAGVLAIPKGATVHGVVTVAKNVGAGDLGGSSELALQLTSLDLGGASYPLTTDQFRVRGPNKAGQTVGNAVGGALLGAIIGGIAGRGEGAAIGAGAGAVAGTAASAASPGPGVWIPAEALVTFHLAAPLSVNPVDPQEAARLAQGLYAGGPNLYRRGYYPYRSPYMAYGYPYAYPPVYYRPYFMIGGYYYWR
jgi:BON domain